MASPRLMLQILFIRMNNRITRWRRVRVSPDRLLVLLARCLQGGVCGRNLVRGADECARCGLCPVKGLLELRDRYGFMLKVAGGGRQALTFVKDPAVSAVVAVACEKELVDGILASFPKPVLGVVNTRPKGACAETQVELSLVEEGVRTMLVSPAGTAGSAVTG